MSQYALRVPDSLFVRARELAERDHTSINQFFVTAIAEKLSSMETESLLAGRAAKADVAAFRRILKRIPGRPVVKDGDRIEAE